MSFGKNYPSQTLDALRKRIAGSVVLEGDSAYDEQRKPWLDVVEQRPSAIVNAANIEDIVEAIKVARELELPLGVQNTGHGITVPCNEGILLRLGLMNKVEVDAAQGIATVGPGVVSKELLAAAGEHGLAFPSGQVSNVGVIGYTLGGGYGWLGRKAGPACKAMRSATVVLADGSVVQTSETENADLFWALRGGGGNFGVVASMTVQLLPIGEVFGGVAYYRIEDAAEVLSFYREWSANLSQNTSTYLRFMSVPPKPELLLHLRGTQACVLGVCHADLATAEMLHEQILNFKKPALDQLKRRPYSEMGSVDFASALENATTFSHVECLRELSDDVVASILEIAKVHMPPLVLLELQHLGGILTSIPRDGMAYTAPEAQFYFKVVSPTLAASLEQLAPLTMEAIHSLGKAYTAEYTYNWMRGDQQTKVPLIFGSEKYEHLQELKLKYDPTNLFHLNLNIAPSISAR